MRSNRRMDLAGRAMRSTERSVERGAPANSCAVRLVSRAYCGESSKMPMPEPDIDASIQSGLDQFLFDYRQQYVDDATADQVLASADNIAQLLEAELLALTGEQGGQLWAALRPYLEQEGLAHDLRIALQLRMTKHLLPSFDRIADRAWHLAEIVVVSRPSLQVQRYMKRATRCYLLDLVPECLVMCRAILENAVNDCYRSQNTAWPRDEEGRTTMRVRLEHAEKNGWLGDTTATELAQMVWTRGSKAAHSDPESVGDALGSLAITMRALPGLLASA